MDKPMALQDGGPFSLRKGNSLKTGTAGWRRQVSNRHNAISKTDALA
jgi:hypothetical protein